MWRAERRWEPTLGAQALKSDRSRPVRTVRDRGYETLDRPLKIAAASRPQTRAGSNRIVFPKRQRLETDPPQPAGEPSESEPDRCRRTVRTRARARYLISVSSLNIGRYMLMITMPTMIPTPSIMIGSTIEVSDWIDASTSSS
jgi:hypothetical protein